LLDEPRNAVVVPGASDLQTDGREVFGGEHAGADAIHVALDGLGQRFLDERRARRNQLDGPAFDDDVLPARRETAGEQVVVDGAKGQKRTSLQRTWGAQRKHQCPSR